MEMDHTGDAGRMAQASASKYENNYTYPNDRRAATLWYHDHAMGATGKNVYMGLAGFYLVEDEEERSLPTEGPLRHPSDAVPTAIQRRRFVSI
jgi:FtsP/CotA-like multicopper oxidase with cupredoxin domain